MTLEESYKLDLAKLSKEELVERFNREVGNRGWVSTRAIYLSELRSAMENAEINIKSVLNSSGGFNLNRKVELKEGNTLVLL
jgi:acetolactate synthase regulatory subunit